MTRILPLCLCKGGLSGYQVLNNGSTVFRTLLPLSIIRVWPSSVLGVTPMTTADFIMQLEVEGETDRERYVTFKIRR